MNIVSQQVFSIDERGMDEVGITPPREAIPGHTGKPTTETQSALLSENDRTDVYYPRRITTCKGSDGDLMTRMIASFPNFGRRVYRHGDEVQCVHCYFLPYVTLAAAYRGRFASTI